MRRPVATLITGIDDGGEHLEIDRLGDMVVRPQ
jgi:hypothetical protein